MSFSNSRRKQESRERFRHLLPNTPFLTYGAQAFDLQEIFDESINKGDFAGWSLHFFGGSTEEEKHNTAHIYAAYKGTFRCDTTSYQNALGDAIFHLERIGGSPEAESLIGLLIAPSQFEIVAQPTDATPKNCYPTY